MQSKDEYSFSFLELEYKHTEKYSIKYLAFINLICNFGLSLG